MSVTTFNFLPTLSKSVKWASGNNIAKGTPGKPPPVPTSNIFYFASNFITFPKDNECKTWFL